MIATNRKLDSFLTETKAPQFQTVQQEAQYRVNLKRELRSLSVPHDKEASTERLEALLSSKQNAKLLQLRCDHCIAKYHLLLKDYLTEEEIRGLNAYGYRAYIEQAQICNIIYHAVGYEFCPHCRGQAFDLDGEIVINYYHPFTSFYRLQVQKRSAKNSVADWGKAEIKCAHCGVVFQKNGGSNS